MNSLEIIARIYRGDLPNELLIKTEYVMELLKLDHSISSGHALLITAARRDNFKDDKDWAAWCEEKFNFNGSYRCHMVQAGRLLLDTIKKIELFQMLYRLEIYKLISLERIDRLRLPEFLKANDVEKLTRDQVRDAVNAWLGREEPNNKLAAKPEKYHPDLFEMIGSVCALRVQTVIDSITDVKKADQACDCGLKLYACSLNYYKQNPETLPIEKIEKLEKAMESELEELRGLKATAAGFKIAK